MSYVDDVVRMLLDTRFSGGCKFTELLCQDEILNLNLKPEELEEAISHSDQVKILEYTWNPCNRVKMFVFTP
jgi:hypothetical protein